MKKFLALLSLGIFLSSPAFADFAYGTEFGEGDISLAANSVVFYETTDPATPSADYIELYAKDDGGTTKLYTMNSSGVASAVVTGSGAAPTDATYITQTANGSLSAEQALSSLATGYVKNTTGTGVLSTQAVPIPIADGGTNATSFTSGQQTYFDGTRLVGSTKHTWTDASALDTITGTAPEQRLVTSGDSDYAREYRTTSNEFVSANKIKLLDYSFTFPYDYSTQGVYSFVHTTTAFPEPSSYTISVWFKTTVASGAPMVNFEDSQNGNSSAHDNKIYMGTDGKVYASTYDGSYKYVTSSSTYNDGNWHHALSTATNSGNLELFIDNVSQGTTAIGTMYDFTAYWRIGGLTNGSITNGLTRSFQGSLSEVDIYHRVVTSGERANLYAHTKPADTTSWVLSYALNESSGTVVADASGASNTGTLYKNFSGISFSDVVKRFRNGPVLASTSTERNIIDHLDSTGLNLGATSYQNYIYGNPVYLNSTDSYVLPDGSLSMDQNGDNVNYIGKLKVWSSGTDLYFNHTALPYDTWRFLKVDTAANIYFYGSPDGGGGIVLNEGGSNTNIQLKGDTDSNAFFLDASADSVGIGTATPGSKLDVAGSFQCDSITNDTGLAAGVYTPTRSSETNLDSNVTMSEAQYMRVGNTVTVSGRFTADPTTTLTPSNFEITLPVASNIGAIEDAAGIAAAGGVAGQVGAINGVVANDTAQIEWNAVDTTSQIWSYQFSYQVI